MENYLDKLNDQQRDAVVYTDGPELVIAGAGSGKTRVLTYKIVHLLANGFEPYRILALTFTNKAAREMRERIESLVGTPVASRLWMGTFHSIFARILRQNAERIGFKRDFTIYDSADSKSLIKSIIKEMQLDDKIYKPSTVQGAISMAKNALMSPEAYAMDRELMEADRRARRPLIHAIYRTYRHRCFVAGAMDFDDLLYYTNVLLRDNPDVLNHYREFFRYILVDEYQDTNFAQHLIVSQLCNGGNNLCVVGDDAQSIYSFRGANIRNILNLKNAYPGLRIFKLEQNYRSTQNIINAANSLIEKNTQQIRKKVFSRNDVGSRIEVVQSSSDYEESYLVANRISLLRMRTKDSYEEFAVLYRTNAQSRLLEEALRKRNIPYRIYGGLSFYQRKEIKDAVAYFRMAVNPDDGEALRRIINNPSRGIGDTTLNRLMRCAIDNGVSIWNVICNLETLETGVNSGGIKKLNGFRELIASFIELNASGADAETVATKIIRDTGLMSALLSDRTPESISQHENLAELLNGVKEFVSTRREEDAGASVGISDFLAEVSLATDQDENEGQTEERVTLMTVHAAKGLEFGNVFIVGVEENLFPSAKSFSSESEMEEERRLMYVALTRAKRFCMISYASKRFCSGYKVRCDTSEDEKYQKISPSRFIYDIDPRYLKLETGSSLGGGYDKVNPVENYRASFHSSPLSFERRDSKPVQQSSRAGFREAMSLRENASRQLSPTTPLTAGDYNIHSPSELKEGMRIEHPRFGRGVIKSIDTESVDARITVMFSNVDVKTLLLKFAKFNILD